MMINNFKVSIIIVTFNGKKHILNCLESVKRTTYADYEIIVVDNGSKDGTPEIIKKNFPDIRLILNNKNLGFTGGNNEGIKQARGNIIFLLNDDTVIHPQLVEVLVRELTKSSGIGIVGPKIYFMSEAINQSDKIWFAGGKINWAGGSSAHLGRNLTDEELIEDSQKEIDFITGCALMIKREVIDKIGLLDDRFFAFYEDADWCQKAKKAGYKVVYVPFGGVWHIKSATASHVFLEDLKSKLSRAEFFERILIYARMSGRYLANSWGHKYRIHRNQFIFFMRHAPLKYKITFLLKFIFISTPRFLWSILTQTPLSLFKIYCHR